MAILSQGFMRSVVFRNFTSLGLMQIANYIVPIIVIPYVAHVLGVEKFGIVSYAQNIAAYLTLLVNFGFDYTAARNIALNRDNKEKVNKIFWSVMTMKMVLFVVSLLLLWSYSAYNVRIETDPLLFFYAALYNLGLLLFPNWYFQGIEKMGWISIINCIIKILGAVLVFLFIHREGDYRLYVFLYSFSFIIGGCWSLWHIFRHFPISVRYFSFGDKSLLKESFPIFLNLSFSSVYSLFGITFIGLYFTDYEVGIYSGGYRIIMAVVQVVTGSLTMALFPAISRRFQNFEDGWRYFCRCLFVSGVGAACVSFLLLLFAPLAVKILLGSLYQSSIPVVQAMFLMPFLVTMSSLLTVQGIYGLRLQRFSPLIGICCMLVSLCLNLYAVPKFGYYGAVASWAGACIAESLLTVSFLLYYKRRRTNG